MEHHLDIVDVIGLFVDLEPAGKDNYVGLCPFHKEETPSFSVSSKKQFFHCFGCKASGDVVSFAAKLLSGHKRKRQNDLPSNMPKL